MLLQDQNSKSPDSGFLELSRLAYDEAGLVLAPAKSAMIQSRLRHRLKALNMSSLVEYCGYVGGENGHSERPYMISALTTNVSSFFREPHHFELVSELLMDRLISDLKKGKSIRIWSAGCSNGQEPYSLAMHLLEYDDAFLNGDCKILATDIDQDVLAFAKHGVYDVQQVDGIEGPRKARFFSCVESRATENAFQVSDDLKSMIHFRRLNLIGDWPMRAEYDLVFCRNVLIYFDAATQDRLWPKFQKVLKSDGIVCVGHSERITSDEFVSVGPTAYRKRDDGLSSNSMSDERSA